MKDIFESSGFNEEMENISENAMQNLSDKEKDFFRKQQALINYRNQVYLAKIKKVNEDSYIELNVKTCNFRRI
jgi:hypothetical protein